MTNDKNLISLKEAAKMSGYSPDYVGQLIRAGKIPGKQVFSNVAWMTTEEAMLEFMQKDQKGKKGKNAAPGTRGLKDLIFTSEGLVRMYSVVAWIAIGTLAFFILVLVSIFAISADRTINEKYQQKIIDSNNS